MVEFFEMFLHMTPDCGRHIDVPTRIFKFHQRMLLLARTATAWWANKTAYQMSSQLFVKLKSLGASCRLVQIVWVQATQKWRIVAAHQTKRQSYPLRDSATFAGPRYLHLVTIFCHSPP